MTLEGVADADLCPVSGNTCSGKACIFSRLGKQAVSQFSWSSN